MRGHRRVQMIVSVGGDHVAGKQYDLPVEIADRYVARGYAAGSLSREYDADELQQLKGNPQVVNVGG
jgi:hypothetical protein